MAEKCHPSIVNLLLPMEKWEVDRFVGIGRKVPFLGKTDPLVTLGFPFKTLPDGTRKLIGMCDGTGMRNLLTFDVYTFYLPGFKDFRATLAQTFVKTVFDPKTGLPSQIQFDKEKPNLIPVVFNGLVEAVGSGRARIAKDGFDPLHFFEQRGGLRQELGHVSKAIIQPACIVSLGAVTALAYAAATNPGETIEMVDNTKKIETVRAVATSLGAVIGGGLGALIKRDAKLAAAVVGTLIGGAATYAGAQWATSGVPRIERILHNPFQDAVNNIEIAGAVGLVGTEVLSLVYQKHVLNRVHGYIPKMEGSKTLLTLVADQLQYLGDFNVRRNKGGKELNPTVSVMPAFKRDEDYTSAIQRYDRLETKTHGPFHALIGPRFIDLSHLLIDAETIKWEDNIYRIEAAQAKERKEKKKIEVKPIQWAPHPDDFFHNIRFDDSIRLYGHVKALRNLNEHPDLGAVAALMNIMPTLRLAMLAHTFHEDVKARADAQNFGKAGNQLGLQEAAPEIVRIYLEKFQTATTDSHRQAVFTDHLRGLAELYKQVTTVGPISENASLPPFMRLGALYGTVFQGCQDVVGDGLGKRGVEHIIEATLQANKLNPLIPHMVLADLQMAIDKAPILLVKQDEYTRAQILIGLSKARVEIIELLLDDALPYEQSAYKEFIKNPDSIKKLNVLIRLMLETDNVQERDLVLKKLHVFSSHSNECLSDLNSTSTLSTVARRSGILLERTQYPFAWIDALSFSKTMAQKINGDSRRINPLVRTLEDMVHTMTWEAIHCMGVGSGFPYNDERAAWTNAFIPYAFDNLNPANQLALVNDLIDAIIEAAGSAEVNVTAHTNNPQETDRVYSSLSAIGYKLANKLAKKNNADNNGSGVTQERETHTRLVAALNDMSTKFTSASGRPIRSFDGSTVVTAQ